MHRGGMVLVVVLVVIAMLSLTVYSYTSSMLVEHQGSIVHGRQVQTRALASSGVAMLRMFLMQEEEVRQQSGGVFDNPELMQGVLVVDSDSDAQRARFCVLAPSERDGDISGVRYGLEDESTRLNLAALMLADESSENGGRQLLMALPGMTEEIADAILDWIDEDDEPREFGAEADYYSSLDPPYAPTNGPPATVEELLLVRDVTPWLLFGADGNRNGSVDPHEEGAVLLSEADAEPGAMDRGWSAYLTLYSAEANTRPDGEPKIDLNGGDLQQLYDDLSAEFDDEWATYIVALRQSGPFTGAKAGETGVTGQLDLSKPARHKFTQVLDLIGGKVSVTFDGDDEATVIASPFAESPLAYSVYLAKLFDHVAVNTAESIPGRININQASRTVLAGIPGMDEAILEGIIGGRSAEVTDQNPGHRHETWILAESIVDLAQMKALVPYITAGGDVYRAQVVGYFDEGGPSARLEIVIDATSDLPRMVFLRDISHLGRGYSLETLGVETRE